MPPIVYLGTMSKAEKVPLAGQRSWALLRRLLAEAVRPHWLSMAGAALCMIAVAATTAATAWLMDPVVNEVFVERNRDMLWLVGGAVLATFVVKSFASYFQEALLSLVGLRVIADMQNRLFRHLIGHDVALIQSRHSGALLSHFTYDINAMRNAVSNALVGIGRDTLSIIFLVAVMFYQEWLLACISLVAAPLTILPIQRLGKRMRRVSGQTQDEMGLLTTSLSQAFQGIRVIKAYGMEAWESRRVAAQVASILRLTYRAARVRAATQPIIDAFGGLAVAAVIVYGGFRVIDGHTTAGAFFSFIAAVLMAYQPMRALAKVAPALQEGLAAAERVFGLLDRPSGLPTPTEPKPVPRVAGEVRFEDVVFSYGEGQPALRGLSLAAAAGRVTALVGPSGAGKSTVFNLIPRFYDAESGTVTVNGVDVREADTEELRRAIALVSQEVVLFDDTVINNIRYGRLDATDEEVFAAARAAAADVFIAGLADGYQTVVGEHGLRLSGGQRQRIAIARALLRNAPVLLLDEATSALDTESERQIQDALSVLMQGRTTLVIAHRLSTVMHADMIHVFDGGRVVESGDHASLLRQGGLYARLHDLQFAREEAAA
jgi:subfamily B ATP-binding cassette protein MsbA